MNRAAVVVTLSLFACGSPAQNVTQPDAAGSGVTPDAASSSPDAALPVLGSSCPDQLTEAARITAAADAYPYTISNVLVGKIDNTGHDDVVAVETDYDSVNSRYLLRFKNYLSDGTTFATPVVSNATWQQYSPESMFLGDFNGDHLQDIAIAYTDSGDESRTSYIYIAMQQANHTFVLGNGIDLSSCKFSSDERYFGLAVIDTDHDGKDDLLATISYDGLGADPAGLSLLKGTTSGLASPLCASNMAGFPAQLATASRLRVGDFDGDGQPDIAGLYDTQLLLYRYTSPSTFTPAAEVAMWTNDDRVVVDPINHGLVELDMQSGGSTATRFKSDTNGFVKSAIGSFPTESAPLGNYDAIRGFAVGDFNSDGLTDVITVGNHNYGDSNPGYVTYGLACDRNAHYDIVTGGFPDSVFQVQPISYNGKNDIIVEDGSDLVIYSMH